MNQIARLLMILSVVLLTSCATKIPVYVIKVADDDGSHMAAVTEDDIEAMLDKANDIWSNQGIKFTFSDNDMMTIRSSRLNKQPHNANNPQWELYRLTGNYVATTIPGNKIALIVRNDGSRVWSGVPGHTNFISLPPYKSSCKKVDTGCISDKSTLAHAFGHYFGLGHTFATQDCSTTTRDNADADARALPMNSVAAVSDTTADPGAGCLTKEQLRRQPGTVNIKNGEEFSPPWRNLMSGYINSRKYLSSDQAAIIGNVMKNHIWRNRLEED